METMNQIIVDGQHPNNSEKINGLNNSSMGTVAFDVPIVVNPKNHKFPTDKPLVIDIEDNESGSFVGIGVYRFSDAFVFYFTNIEDALKAALENCQLIGQNIKYDLKQLQKWGVKVGSKNIADDTIIMSYVMNTTKESHSLKDLAKEYLGLDWTTYKEMVHPDGCHKKVTLDKQPVEKVAWYCCSDVIATYKLHQYFQRKMTPNDKRIYNTVELPLLKLLFDMEQTGIRVDVDYLKELKTEFDGELTQLQDKLAKTLGSVNLNSPKQLKEAFAKIGLPLAATNKDALEQYASHDVVKELLEYRQVKKLASTYVDATLENPTLPIIHSTFNQVAVGSDNEMKGIRTGRLSSSHPNLQNIPARSERGKKLRKLFVPSPGNLLICADYSQIEYRLLAHFTQEPRLLEAFKNGKDVHEETGKALGVSRDVGKTLNFAAIYGAHSQKIARTAKVTEAEATAFLANYWRVLPSVRAWIERVKYEARQRKGVRTLMNRWLALPGIASNNKWERMHWERVAVNSVIQGSAAEVIKLAMLKIAPYYKPILTVHDELLFELKDDRALSGGWGSNVEGAVIDIRQIMETVVSLSVPLAVDIGAGKSWGEAKEI